MDTLVSVIMPAKNAAKFIKNSIESILNQTFPYIELIIINDQSTDNTLEVVERFADERIKVVTGTSTGISAAFNLGLKASRGKYICRCDSDDLYPTNRIKTQVDWLEANKNHVAVCGMFSTIDRKGTHLVQFHRDSQSQTLDEEFKNAITRTHFGTFMVRADILKEIGGCRSFFVTAEDIDLQLRISEKGSVFFIAENFYKYRLHDLSITHSQSSTKREFYEKIARDHHLLRLKNGIDPIIEGIIPNIPSDDIKARDSTGQIINHLISESWYWHHKNKKKQAIITAIKIVKLWPFKWHVWRNLLIICVKK